MGVCSVEGCNAPSRARGWCRLHYGRWFKWGDPLGGGRQPAPHGRNECVVDGCHKEPRSLACDYCEMHYMRLRRRGTLETKLDMSIHQQCLHCGNPLSEQTKFCSERCRTRYYRGVPKERECKHCGVTFQPLERNVCCSEECRHELNMHERRIYHKRYWRDSAKYRAELRANYHKRRMLVNYVTVELVDNETVFERDGWVCKLCGGQIDRNTKWPDPWSASVDHIVPLSRGGNHSYANVQCAHLRCNCQKSDKLQRQVRMFNDAPTP